MKLVRDNIPGMHARDELGPHPSGVDRSRQVFRKATPEEYRLLLYMKLVEEVGEIVSAMTRGHRLEECGDLEDLIKAIYDMEGYSHHDWIKRCEKSERFGGFAEGWVLEWTETEKETEG